MAKGRPRKKLDDSVFSNRVAARIIELMGKREVSIEDLFDGMQQAGFTKKIGTLRKWLQGQNPVDIEAIPYIAFVLQVRPRMIIPDEPIPKF